MHDVAKEMDVSSKTVHSHIKLHDRQIRTIGIYPKCRRTESVYAEVEAAR